MCAAVNVASASACCDLGSFDLLAGIARLLQQLRPLVRRCFADLLADDLLIGAQRVGARDRGPARDIGRQQGVDQRRVFAPLPLRLAHGVRILPEQFQVDHGLKPYAVGIPRRQTISLL